MSFNNERGFGSRNDTGGFGSSTSSGFGSRTSDTGGFGRSSSIDTDTGGFGTAKTTNESRTFMGSSTLRGFFNTQDRVGTDSEFGRMTIERIIMVPAGSYYNQHYRPLTSHVSPQKLDFFAEATNFGKDLLSTTIARANADLLTPSANTSSEVAQIANGWDTARYTFIMRINATLAGEVDMTYLLFGYTSNTGCTASGNVDPYMELYFTRCISMRNMETSTFGVKNSTPAISAAHNILFRDKTSRDRLFTLRPSDTIGNAALPKVVEDFDSYTSFDSRAILNKTPKLSKMAWSNPNVYLSRSLSHYATVMNSPEDGMGAMGNHYSQLLDGVQDENPINCAPLRFMRNNTAWGEDMCVTWSELVNAFPEAEHDSISEFQYASPAQLSAMDGRVNANNNNGASYENIIASRLGQELPALLINNQFVSIGFTATNDNMDEYGRPVVIVDGGYEHMTGSEVMINASLAAFRSSFADLVFMSLSRNNQVGLTLKVFFSIYGNGSVQINYNNKGFESFNIPIYAESITSMMVTNDAHSLNNLSASFGKLMEVVEAGDNSRAPKFGSIPGFGF